MQTKTLEWDIERKKKNKISIIDKLDTKIANY